MDIETIWQHTHHERRALHDLLARLTPEQWEAPSACPGWRVQDVAAHAVFAPQYRWRDVPRMLAAGRLDMDRAILVDGQRLGALPRAEILAAFERFATSRSRPPMETPMEPLTDVLVHTQDIARPLGLEHPMPAEAAAAATDRVLHQARAFHHPPAHRLHLEATDTAWSHAGPGPLLCGPMAELLMLLTGRAARAATLEGEGAALVRAA